MSACFWSQFTPDPFPFCEAQLCSLVSQPANTWTNIGYAVVAVLIARNHRFYCDKKYFAAVVFALAIGSSLFHMSGTLWGKVLDVGSMLALSSLTLTLSLRRLVSSTRLQTNLTFAFLFLSSVPFIIVGRLGGMLFLIQCAASIAIEFYLARRETLSAERKSALKRVALVFPVALVLNYMDQNGPLCWPTNHVLTVHGIWHLATAYVIYQVAVLYLLEKPSVLESQEQSIRAS